MAEGESTLLFRFRINFALPLVFIALTRTLIHTDKNMQTRLAHSVSPLGANNINNSVIFQLNECRPQLHLLLHLRLVSV